MTTQIKAGVIAANAVNSSELASGALSGQNFTGDVTFDTTTLVIDSSNNRVGIGTDSPAYKIDSRVSTSASIVAGLNLDASGNNNGDGSAINFSRADNVLSSVAKISAVKAEVSNNETDLVFSNYAAGSLTEKMRIVGATGNVGIGTTSPAAPLDIKLNTNSTADIFKFQRLDGAVAGVLNYNGIDGAISLGTTTSHDLTFDTANTERMRIDSSGLVRIGASGGTGQRLSINGFTQSDTMSEANAWLVAEANGGDGIAIGTRANSPYATWIQSGYLNTLGTSNHYALALNPHGGNVGIGNISPTSNLTIGSAQGDGLEFTYDGTNTYRHRIANYWNSSTDSRMDFEIGRTGNVAPTTLLSVGYNSNVGIGTQSPDAKLKVEGDGTWIRHSGYGQLLDMGNWTDGLVRIESTGAPMYIRAAGSNYMSFDTNSVERYRIDSKGTLFSGSSSFAHNTYAHAAVFSKNSTPLGTVVIEDSDVSSGIGNTVLNCYLRDQDPATFATFIRFTDGGGTVGSITHNDDGGGVTYNTTSDYRLKENVNYDWDALSLLNQLKPAKFNFIRQPSKTLQGFLAHEVKDIVPSSVQGEKDQMMDIGTITDSNGDVIYEGVYEHFCKTDEGQTWTRTGEEPLYQELDYSRLVPLLTKAIQEQQTIIDDLKSRLDEAGL